MAYRLSFRSMGLLTIGGVSVFASAWASASSLSGTAYTPTWVWVCLVGFACLICMGVLWELHQRQQVRRLSLQHGLAQDDTLSRITQQMSALQNSNMTAAAKAQELNQRLRMVFDLADDGMFLLKVELADSFRVLAANKAYLRLLTRDKKQTIGHRIDELRADEQDKKTLLKSCKQAAQEGEPVYFTETLHTSHGILHLETTLTPIFDELRYCTHIQGVSRLQQGSGAQNTLLQVAQYDALTGLPKNDAILTHMQTLLSPRGIQKHPFAVVCLQVNTYAQWLQMGHHTVNTLMQTLAHRLRTHLHEGDVIGVSQDNTFVWVLHDSPTQKSIENRISNLLNAINLPILAPQGMVESYVTAGISCAPEDSMQAQDLWGYAHHAAQAAYTQQCVFLFHQTTEQQNAQLERSGLEAALRQALVNEDFAMHYQPIVDHLHNIGMVEAFIYWQHPLLGHLKAQQFFALAQECHLAAPISRKALEKACQQFAWWRNSLPKHAQHIQLNLNVSGQHFAELDFIAHLQQTLQQNALKAEDIILDLTEASIYHNPEKSTSLLLDLRQMGVQVMVDDFGTGFSSLTGLQRFAVDGIKIDHSFIQQIPHKAEESAVVTSLIQMGHSLNLRVIAEGVETEAQQDFLQHAQCDGMQGQAIGGCNSLESLNIRLSKPKLSILSA